MMNICMSVCMYVYMFVCLYVYMYMSVCPMSVCMCAAHVRTCAYVFIYTCKERRNTETNGTCIHTHIRHRPSTLNPYPDPREDPKSRSLNGGSYKVPLVV